jgi:hypothetical protein
VTRSIASVFLFALLLMCGACLSPVTLHPPAGYAVMEPDGSYRAVSPEGMPLRIRSFENTPEKSLDFWSEALRNHLQKEGYRPIGSMQEFQAGDIPGASFEWAVPYGSEDYIYLTALLVTRKRIYLAEAAAPYPLYEQYRAKLMESLLTIRPR